MMRNPFLVVCFALLCYLLAAHAAGETPQWFTQKVDHFDAQNTNVWQQRYTVNNTFYTNKPGSPVFFYLAGEAPMEFFEFQEVQALNWAKKFGALYIVLEHRYYGNSFPVPDLSTKNMRFLSSQQALADAAHFVETYNAAMTNQGPWVVFGCSYSGALSAWFRSKYPNLVVGSVAPSGPVLALTDFTQFYSQFEKSADPECVSLAKKAVGLVSQMLTTDAGRAQLAKLFNSCEPITADNDWYFLYSITGVLGSQDQMNNPPTWILNQTCDIMKQGSDVVANWAQVFNTPWDDVAAPVSNNARKNIYRPKNAILGAKKMKITESAPACNSFDENLYITQTQQNVSLSNYDGRSWLWQTCVEFGFFQTSENGSSIFFPNLDVGHVLSWCEKIFGIPGMAPDVNFTNLYYGGMNLQATNVMFTNGLLDPWHNLSINQDLPSGVQAVTYEAGHCASLIAATEQDPPSLIDARLKVEQFLANLLK